MQLELIRSNIEIHGLLWAVRHEEARYLKQGISPQRAVALAFSLCTGRYIA
jgi:hypothetical protein